MATYHHSSGQGKGSSRLALPAAVTLLLVGVCVPPSVGSYADAVGGVFVGLTTPLSHPLSRLARFLNPPRPRSVDSEIEAQLRNELDLANKQVNALEADREELLEVIASLQQLKAVDWDRPIRLLAAPVVGASSDLSSSLLRVRAGSGDGLREGSVAAATLADPSGAETTGAQLVGRVTQVGVRVSSVRPINEHGAPSFGAYVQTGAGVGLATTLTPGEDGELTGPVEYGEGAARAREGLVVRLRDETWPGAAQGLAVGRIESVKTDIDGRQTIVVRPELRLRNVARVTFWLDWTDEGGEAGG